MFNNRPVKVIRLVGRHSVEEIVLKRANSKLQLTNTVIEGGQVWYNTGWLPGLGT